MCKFERSIEFDGVIIVLYMKMLVKFLEES